MFLKILLIIVPVRLTQELASSMVLDLGLPSDFALRLHAAINTRVIQHIEVISAIYFIKLVFHQNADEGIAVSAVRFEAMSWIIKGVASLRDERSVGSSI